MKKYIPVILVLCLLFGCSGCGKDSKESEEVENTAGVLADADDGKVYIPDDMDIEFNDHSVNRADMGFTLDFVSGVGTAIEQVELNLQDVAAVETEEMDAGGKYQVIVAFTEAGAEKFRQLTASLSGAGEELGIRYNGVMISTKTITEEIGDGKAVVIENLTKDKAEEIAEEIREAIPE